MIVSASTLSGRGSGLAREARHDEIHRTMEGGSGELPHVAEPDRRRSHVASPHRRFQTGGSERFPLHQADEASIEAHVAESGDDAAFKSADAGEEPEHPDGISHMHPPLRSP